MDALELAKLGREYLNDKRKKAGDPKFQSISASRRPKWVKAVAFGIVCTAEATVTAAVAAREVQLEVRHQREIRAGKRLLREMEHNGYVEVDYTEPTE